MEPTVVGQLALLDVVEVADEELGFLGELDFQALSVKVHAAHESHAAEDAFDRFELAVAEGNRNVLLVLGAFPAQYLAAFLRLARIEKGEGGRAYSEYGLNKRVGDVLRDVFDEDLAYLVLVECVEECGHGAAGHGVGGGEQLLARGQERGRRADDLRLRRAQRGPVGWLGMGYLGSCSAAGTFLLTGLAPLFGLLPNFEY